MAREREVSQEEVYRIRDASRAYLSPGTIRSIVQITVPHEKLYDIATRTISKETSSVTGRLSLERFRRLRRKAKNTAYSDDVEKLRDDYKEGFVQTSVVTEILLTNYNDDGSLFLWESGIRSIEDMPAVTKLGRKYIDQFRREIIYTLNALTEKESRETDEITFGEIFDEMVPTLAKGEDEKTFRTIWALLSNRDPAKQFLSAVLDFYKMAKYFSRGKMPDGTGLPEDLADVSFIETSSRVSESSTEDPITLGKNVLMFLERKRKTLDRIDPGIYREHVEFMTAYFLESGLKSYRRRKGIEKDMEEQRNTHGQQMERQKGLNEKLAQEARDRESELEKKEKELLEVNAEKRRLEEQIREIDPSNMKRFRKELGDASSRIKSLEREKERLVEEGRLADAENESLSKYAERLEMRVKSLHAKVGGLDIFHELESSLRDTPWAGRAYLVTAAIYDGSKGGALQGGARVSRKRLEKNAGERLLTHMRKDVPGIIDDLQQAGVYRNNGGWSLAGELEDIKDTHLKAVVKKMLELESQEFS